MRLVSGAHASREARREPGHRRANIPIAVRKHCRTPTSSRTAITDRARPAAESPRVSEIFRGMRKMARSGLPQGSDPGTRALRLRTSPDAARGRALHASPSAVGRPAAVLCVAAPRRNRVRGASGGRTAGPRHRGRRFLGHLRRCRSPGWLQALPEAAPRSSAEAESATVIVGRLGSRVYVNARKIG